MRISEHLLKISLNINIFGFKIDESFDWDISNPDNSPEEFAADLVADLSLEAGKTTLGYVKVASMEKAVAFEIRR